MTKIRLSSQFINFSKRELLMVAGTLAYLVAGLHLLHPKHGFGRLLLLLTYDPTLLLTTPRPVAFIGSALAIIIVIPLTAYKLPKKPIYLLGMLLMATYIVGYFAWHLSGHGGFLPGRDPLYHGLQPHEAVIAHITGDLWAAAAVLLEIILLATLAVLYRS